MAKQRVLVEHRLAEQHGIKREYFRAVRKERWSGTAMTDGRPVYYGRVTINKDVYAVVKLPHRDYWLALRNMTEAGLS